MDSQTSPAQDSEREQYRAELRTKLIEQLKGFKRFMLAQGGSRAETIHLESLADLLMKERFGER